MGDVFLTGAKLGNIHKKHAIGGKVYSAAQISVIALPGRAPFPCRCGCSV